MIKGLWFVLFSVACTRAASAQFLYYKPGVDTSLEPCVVGQMEAFKDIKAGTMRFFSMGLPELMVSDLSNHFRREHFGLKVKRGGCMVMDDVICYNETVDSFFRARGIDLDAEISRKVDSFNASVPRRKLPGLYNSIGISYYVKKRRYEAPKALQEERWQKEL